MSTIHSQPQKNVWDWTARVHASQSELGCSYTVIIFIGTVPEDPKEWLVCPEFVGSHSVHMSSGGGYGRRPKSDMTEGFVHLSQAIAKRSGLDSLEPEVVAPYLTTNLSWRVQKSDDSAAALESLEVVVFATPLTLPPGEPFPVPGEPQRYDNITRGKPGGSTGESTD